MTRQRGLNGLVLLGGLSSRMGMDKGSLVYPPSTGNVRGAEQRRRCFDLLELVCEKTFVSCRAEKASEHANDFPVITDSVRGEGPGAGILSAAKQFPEAAWLVLACDFPFADEEAVGFLAKHRSHERPATVYAEDLHLIEPLFAIWEKPALEELAKGFEAGDWSPRRALERVDQRLGCERLQPPVRRALVNVNSPEDSRAHGLS